MKVVLKEWLKDKTACGLMVIWFIAQVIATYISVFTISIVSDTIADIDNMSYHMPRLIAFLTASIIIQVITTYCRPRAINHLYSFLYDQYNGKILDSDYDLYSKYSAVKIDTISDFIWKITNVGRSTLNQIISAISIVVTLIAMWKIAGEVVFPILGIYLLAALLLKVLFKKYDEMHQKATKIMHKRNQEFENMINGFQEVRSFNLSNKYRKNIHEMNMETMRLMNKKNLLNIPIDFSIEVIDTVALIIIIFYAAKLMGMNVLTQSAAMSLVMYVWRIINPIINIVDYFDQLSDDLSLKKDYEEIMSYQNKTIDSGTINLQSFEDKIELKHVGFAYNDSSTILNDVSMVIKKGQRIGICGVSGGGKTTLFKLLNKFYQVTKGEIAIDGINLNDISSESYRKFVGTVHQDNTIFPGTIKENIAYGVSSYTEYELIEACKKANIYEFIMGLEKKFDTEVGPRGVKLSGGQRQRIALARVFMVNPEIILLDEATSALDSESETMIQDAIDNTKDKTIITIAHRLDTIKNCDCIYVMGNHKIVESGTYDELINQHGIFYSMVNTKNKERQ